MIEALARFVDALRAERVSVSPAEIVDAGRALELVDLESRSDVRRALRATLAKDRQAAETFDRLFDRFFAPPALERPGRDTGRAATTADRPRQGEGERADRRRARPRLEAGDDARKNASLEPRRERAALSEMLGRARRSGNRGPVRLRRVKLRRAGEQVSDPAHRDLARRMTTEEEREVAREIPRVVHALKLRISRRLVAARAGRPWLRRALRDNLRHGGVPFVIPYRAPKRQRARVVLFIDVSFSVARAAGLFLLLAKAFVELGRRARVLAFVDRPVDATAAIAGWMRGTYQRPHADDTPRPRRHARPGHGVTSRDVSFADVLDDLHELNLEAPSDYGRAFHALRNSRLRPRGRETVLLVLGDGRTNRFDPLPFALEELARGCRAVLWLVPEPRSRWGTADSALPDYLASVDLVVEATDLLGLARGLGESSGGCDVPVPAAGTVIAWWEHDAIAFGVVVLEEKQRVVLVTADGREERVAPARVLAALASGPAPGRTSEGRREAAEVASRMAKAVADRSASVDVATLWDLTKGESHAIDEAVLAELALASADAPACLATALALARDGVRFVRKPSGWQPRGEDAVAEILVERDQIARRAMEKASAFEALARAWSRGSWQGTGSAVERRVLSALEALAVSDLEAPEKERVLALEALEAAGVRGDRPAEAAFRLLRRTGRFNSDDENLAVVRFGLRTAFAEDTLLAAERACASGFERAARRDLTTRVAFTIDDAATREVDDALSVEDRGNDLVEVGIHIADPCAFVVPGDPVDLEARARGTTYYFPQGKLLMLPPVLSEGAASLVAGEDRPALSFLVTVDPGGSVVGAEIVRSVVRVAARLDYDEVDATLGAGRGAHAEALSRLRDVASRRERLRRAHGAISLRAPESEIRVAPDGSLALIRRDPDTPAQRLVSEAMILAGEVAAAWLDARRVPAIFRRQSAPEGRLPEADPSQPDAVYVRAMRRLLKRGEAGLHPGAHHALGLAAYVQVTSPLRRYQDLSMHRQISSVLAGGPPEYNAVEMQSLLAATERAENEGRRAERAMDRYWLLRWLERSIDATVTGVVVDVSPRPIVVLDETLLEQAVPSLVDASPGDRVRLRVERVNPRADLLVLRPA